MTAKIFSDTDIIGYADLKVGDETMGCVYGEFMPTDIYYNKIQKTVWECNETGNFKNWYSLEINAQLENDFFLFPVGGYSIDDLPGLSFEPKRIDIAGLHWHVLADFFNNQPPRPFLEEPWSPIDISRKLALERELKLEIGDTNNSFISMIADRKKHTLTNYTFSALATSLQLDDVLFAVHNRATIACYAVVHLTWSRKKETNTLFPATTFYESFDEFKMARMYPDKADWED